MTSVTIDRVLLRQVNLPPKLERTDAIQSFVTQETILLSLVCSVVQPEVARIGGITPWIKTAHLAETFDVPVSPHLLMELHVSLCAAVPKATWVEYIPQLEDITHSRMEVEDGFAIPPDAHGLGIDWNWDAIEKRQKIYLEIQHAT
jgi:L-alanine-DL-glutamate epimerase-like enolase superfamily enzyme